MTTPKPAYRSEGEQMQLVNLHQKGQHVDALEGGVSHDDASAVAVGGRTAKVTPLAATTT